jgi:hypothetical protein
MSPTLRTLATETNDLLTACRRLASEVAARVDPIAAMHASRAASELESLVELLEDPETEVRR